MKKIAVLISGIDEEYQNTILRGVQDCAKEHNVHVVHFVAFGGVLSDISHDAGENNIYNLCNYSEFDGVVLLTNTISDGAVTVEIVKQLQDYNIPVCSIDNDLDAKFYHIGIDNLAAMEEMVRHVIFHHGVRNIGYISGPPNNPESILRLNAFNRVMRDADLPVTEDMIFYGSFRTCDGKDGANYFLNRGNVPEAIVCANDAMAIATMLELQEHGLRVPEDVIVTGFDDTYAARNFSPSITSVKRPLYQSGYLAVEKLLGLRPLESPRSEILPTSCEYRDSCGCTVEKNLAELQQQDREFRRSSYHTIDYYNVNIPMINSMSCTLAESDSFAENLELLKEYVRKSSCERFYLCMNQNWNEVRREADPSGQKFNLIDTCVSHGFTEQMDVPLAYMNGEFCSLPSFPVSQMLPAEEYSFGDTMFYYMLPLHFRDRGFGYCILCSRNKNLETPMLHSWAMNIGNSLESIRKMEYLDLAMHELDQLYIIDPLCRINNRNGFNKFAGELFDACKEKHSSVMMMFIDMDGLKYINDTFSHKEGDSALRNLAKSIKMSCRNGEVYARFGGDEFIVFAPELTEADAKAIADRIQERMDEYNATSGKPYKLMASIGWYISEVDEESKLYPLITAADMKMYEEKKRKKVSRYLRH